MMLGIDEHVRAVWRRTIDLGWPIAVEQTLTTMMRTVDLIVTGLFSPAAVAAVGLADLYAQVPLRLGLGLGTGAIALSSQDTGRGAELTRNRAITQAIILGFISGIPLIIVGLLFSQFLITVLGAESEVIALGSIYLAIVFSAAPMRIVGLVASRALQGTGDTRTPMLVRGSSNAVNIVLTVGLGLGLWVFPELGIIGVGLATAISRTVEAVAMTGAIASPWTPAALVFPRNVTVTKQLVTVSLPNFAEGMSSSVANFPFNAIILLFGTEANAAYHIGRRLYQQLTGPLYRSLSVVAAIIVGQTLGEGELLEARESAKAILSFGIITMTTAGVLMFLGARWLVRIFTQDPTTAFYAVQFTRTFAIATFFMGIFFPLAGALRGASDTRTPFYARLTGAFVFMVGGSYVLGIWFGLGMLGVYIGIVLSYICWVLIVGAGFVWGGWQSLAAGMISERAESERPED